MDLLDRAQRGEITGLAFAVAGGAWPDEVGLTGAFTSNPMGNAGLVSLIHYRIHQVIDEVVLWEK